MIISLCTTAEIENLSLWSVLITIAIVVWVRVVDSIVINAEASLNILDLILQTIGFTLVIFFESSADDSS